jgi:hypothetical protein
MVSFVFSLLKSNYSTTSDRAGDGLACKQLGVDELRKRASVAFNDQKRKISALSV